MDYNSNDNISNNNKNETTPDAPRAPTPKTEEYRVLSTVTELDDFISDYDTYYKGKRNIGILVFDKTKYKTPTITKSIVLDKLNLLTVDDLRNDLIEYFDESKGNIKTPEYGDPMYYIKINWDIKDDYKKEIAESIKRDGLIPIEEQIENQTREAEKLIQLIESLIKKNAELRAERSNLEASIQQLKTEKQNLQTKKSMFSNLNPFTKPKQ